MLGEALIDLHGVDGNAAGLGLLPLATLFAPDKKLQRLHVQMPQLAPPWAALSGVALDVYEIHHGQTTTRQDMQAAALHVAQELVPGVVWQCGQGHVLGMYWHGVFENPAVLQALFGASGATLEHTFARLAEGVAQWFARQA